MDYVIYKPHYLKQNCDSGQIPQRIFKALEHPSAEPVQRKAFDFISKRIVLIIFPHIKSMCNSSVCMSENTGKDRRRRNIYSGIFERSYLSISFSRYFIAKVISAETAFLPFTVARALPTPIGPLTLIISTSMSSVSPGTTC